MEGVVNKVDDLSAAVQVIESIGDLIEASKDEAEKLIEAEFAGIFARMGVDVRQIYRGPLFLRGFDDDLRRHLAQEMTQVGVELCFDTVITRVESTQEGICATLGDGRTLEADCLLAATGRTPYSAGLGLESAGVKLAPNGAIEVNEYSSTNVPSIHAIGDVTDWINLTPVAIHEGICLANTLFGNRAMAPDHETVPAAVFSQPPIGTVGMTEEEARAEGFEIDIYRSEFRGLKQTLTSSTTRTPTPTLRCSNWSTTITIHWRSC